MLAVALVPLVIMTIACLLERLEARTVPAEGTRAARRAAATGRAGGTEHVESTEHVATPDAPARRHLRLLPALGAGSEQAGSGQAGSGQAGTGQAGTGQAGTGQAGTGQAGTDSSTVPGDALRRAS